MHLAVLWVPPLLSFILAVRHGKQKRTTSALTITGSGPLGCRPALLTSTSRESAVQESTLEIHEILGTRGPIPSAAPPHLSKAAARPRSGRSQELPRSISSR